MEKINSHTGVSLYAVVNDKVVGVCDINMRGLIESHIGLFGLTVHKEFRGEGIGKLLLQTTIEEAIKQLPQMKIIELSVFANNPVAIELYRKLGFTEYGVLSGGILHRDEYVDHVYMFKKVR